MKLKNYLWISNLIVILLMIILYILGDLVIFVLTYVAITFMLIVRSFLTDGSMIFKITLSLLFIFIMAIQIFVCMDIVFVEGLTRMNPEFWFRRLIAVIIIAFPLIISRYIVVGKYAQYYLPSIKEAATISFAEFKSGVVRMKNFGGTMSKARESLSRENLAKIIKDLPRHDSFNYINEGSLTHEYFDRVKETFDDENIYIAISNTGSPASEIISVFTNKHFNHASLSFDRELETTISYNGGERLYPPGLNSEMLSFFKKKHDASIMVYSLPCTMEQKKFIMTLVEDINTTGSAYNMLGLMLKRSYRPNIMFCSQFVYRMLDLAGLAYFSKRDGKVEPLDFVELDYYRNLTFEYELKL